MLLLLLLLGPGAKRSGDDGKVTIVGHPPPLDLHRRRNNAHNKQSVAEQSRRTHHAQRDRDRQQMDRR